jgi:hypothetical protein
MKFLLLFPIAAMLLTTRRSNVKTAFLSLPTTRTRHVGNDLNVERYAPDLWTDEFAFINQSGHAGIQSDLFYDYRTNVEAYSKWQAWLRAKRPRLLVIWGSMTCPSTQNEPERHRAGVPDAQVHVLDAGHFALDTAARMRSRTWFGTSSALYMGSLWNRRLRDPAYDKI